MNCQVNTPTGLQSVQCRPTPGLEYMQSHQCRSEFGQFGDNVEYSGQPGDVAASHSAGTAYASVARPGPDKVRVERSGEPVEAVSHTPPRQPPVCSGENVNLPEVSLSDTCLLYTSPSPRDRTRSRMPSSA